MGWRGGNGRGGPEELKLLKTENYKVHRFIGEEWLQQVNESTSRCGVGLSNGSKIGTEANETLPVW